jgi:hypothetical protein
MSPPAESPFLSLVIPAYNESERLPVALDAVKAYLVRQPYTAEVLVVDDGSADGTPALVKARSEAWPALRLIEAPHRGKGHAVKLGLLESRGRYTFFCDADFSMPVEEIAKFLPDALGDFDVAIASREGPGAHRYGEPIYRHLMGRVFNTFVRWAVLPGIQDTQCGFKCLRGELARQLASIQTVDGWGFDVELLCAARLWGCQIIEVPIDWHHSASSRIHPLRDSWQMARESLAVRRNARRGRYGPEPRPTAKGAAIGAASAGGPHAGASTPAGTLQARRLRARRRSRSRTGRWR